MYFITTKRMLEVCFSAHPNIQYRTFFVYILPAVHSVPIITMIQSSSDIQRLLLRLPFHPASESIPQ